VSVFYHTNMLLHFNYGDSNMFDSSGVFCVFYKGLLVSWPHFNMK